MNLDQAIQRFLDHLAARRSANTVKSYGADLSQLAVHLDGEFSLSSSSLQAFLRAYGGSPATRARKLSTLRAFARFLKREGLIESDPTEALEAPIRRKRLPKALSKQQAHELLDGAAETKTPLRDAALLELMYAAGLRVSEVVGANLSELDFREGSIRVRGKGNKDRVALFGDPCRRAIELYLKEERVLPSQGDPVFTNSDGARIGVRTAHRVIKRWALKAGLPPETSPHTLRHSF